MMYGDFWSLTTEQDARDESSIFNLHEDISIEALGAIRDLSLPLVQKISSDLKDLFNLESEVSLKNDETAIQKSSRPELLKKNPWFKLAHIRDYLRFRTYINNLSDFSTVIGHFAECYRKNLINFVKIDTKKMFNPGVFGWRMVAIDIRIVSTGLIVEHYMTFSDLIFANENWLHRVYEKWRDEDTDTMTINESKKFYRDAEFSRTAFRALLHQSLLKDAQFDSRMSYTNTRLDQLAESGLRAHFNQP